MKFGIYIHIPYCVQRCPYCDFTTFEQSQILKPFEYIDLILREIQLMHDFIPKVPVSTIYFGGGTPSLVEPHLIEKIFKKLKDLQIKLDPHCEITLEINPKTLTKSTLLDFIKIGFNRFSVGAQTFNSKHLKTCGRIHTDKDTLETVRLLKAQNVNFSLDLLYALPHQTLNDLQNDIDTLISLNPHHISPYCLTVPSTNPLSKNRPLEDIQVKMSETIHKRLVENGYEQYEISNYSKPGFESQHNQIYWSNDSYWGIGLSAHSYFNQNFAPPNGVRFWNIKNLNQYQSSLANARAPLNKLHNKDKISLFQNCYKFHQFEFLKENESLTDYCHIRLRTNKGIHKPSLIRLFPKYSSELNKRLLKLKKSSYLIENGDYVHLTPFGRNLFNLVLKELHF